MSKVLLAKSTSILFVIADHVCFQKIDYCSARQLVEAIGRVVKKSHMIQKYVPRLLIEDFSGIEETRIENNYRIEETIHSSSLSQSSPAVVASKVSEASPASEVSGASAAPVVEVAVVDSPQQKFQPRSPVSHDLFGRGNAGGNKCSLRSQRQGHGCAPSPGTPATPPPPGAPRPANSGESSRRCRIHICVARSQNWCWSRGNKAQRCSPADIRGSFSCMLRTPRSSPAAPCPT